MSSPAPDPRSGNMAWMHDAACTTAPARWFTHPGPSDVAKALDTCRSCPVRQACLATALKHPPDVDVGIWGGTTERQRHQIRAGHLHPDDIPVPGRSEPGPTPTTTATPPKPQPCPVSPPDRPATTVARNRDGDYASADGRTLIVRLLRQPPWMLFIDGQPVARTRTVPTPNTGPGPYCTAPNRPTAPTRRPPATGSRHGGRGS